MCVLYVVRVWNAELMITVNRAHGMYWKFNEFKYIETDGNLIDVVPLIAFVACTYG